MKFSLSEEILKEDDVVFTVDHDVSFPIGIISHLTASEQLANEIDDWDITDKTDAFRDWLKSVEADIVKQEYKCTATDYDIYADRFFKEVLGFNLYGPEIMYNFPDCGLELIFDKSIDFTSGVIPALPETSACTTFIRVRNRKHIIHTTMAPITLLGWSRTYMRRIVSFVVAQLAGAGVPTDIIMNSVKHLWFFEHRDSEENLTKLLRKYSLEYRFAKNYKEFQRAKEIKDKLSKLLKDAEWELICCHNGDSQKVIVHGRGLTQSLVDWLDESDFYVDSFKITDLDI